MFQIPDITLFEGTMIFEVQIISQFNPKFGLLIQEQNVFYEQIQIDNRFCQQRDSYLNLNLSTEGRFTALSRTAHSA